MRVKILLVSILFFSSFALPYSSSASNTKDTIKTPMSSLKDLRSQSTLGSVTPDAGTYGLGVRLGDPTAFSFKYYMGNNKALEFNLGGFGYARGRGYYENHYDYWHDRRGRDYYEHRYDGYRGGSAFIIMADYLIHKDIDLADFEGALQWYYGIGAQLRYRSYRYVYEYRDSKDSPWQREEERVVHAGIGPNGVIGLEYTLEDIPISFFLDARLYLELAPRIFYPDAHAGVGVRYNMK